MTGAQWVQIATVFLSALLGMIVGILIDLFKRHREDVKAARERPRIQVLFDNAEPGCCIETSVFGGSGGTRRYVRLKVNNSGRSTARGVSACVTKLTFPSPGGESRSTFDEDVLDLMLANGRPSPFTLAPGAHRYIDLALVNKPDSPYFGPLISLIFEVTPLRLQDRGFRSIPGEFGAEVFVSAENAEAERRILTWSWDGAFPGLEITGNSSVRSACGALPEFPFAWLLRGFRSGFRRLVFRKPH